MQESDRPELRSQDPAPARPSPWSEEVSGLGRGVSPSSPVQEGASMTLQCTKSAGHWRVGSGREGGLGGAEDKGQIKSPESPSPPLLNPRLALGMVWNARFKDHVTKAQSRPGTCPRSHTENSGFWIPNLDYYFL